MNSEILQKTELLKEIEKLKHENHILRKVIQTNNHTLGRMIDYFILSQDYEHSERL